MAGTDRNHLAWMTIGLADMTRPADANEIEGESFRMPPVGPGYGLVPDYPDAALERLNEEHGMIDLSACRSKPAIGDVIRIVPNHVCVVSNPHDEVMLTRSNEVVGTRHVAARGNTR